MADSVSKTNIPVLRTPYGSEVPPKVPVCATDDVGSNINPVYVANKTIVASDASLGDSVTPIYMKNGEMTACEELAPRTAPSLQRKSGGGTTTDDVPTSATPTSSDPSTMIATKGYVDNKATKVTVSPKTTAGSVICAITVEGSEYLIYNGGGGGGGTTETICVPLLTPMWFDHLLVGDDTWLESQCTTDQTTDNMHTNADFPKIYAHLLAEYSAGTAKTDTYTLNTGSTVSISYKEAADGHKICTTSELTKLNSLFNDDTIGTAWYFVLDTTNEKFQLPRTKYGFHGNKSYVKRTQAGEQSMRLFFYTGVGPTSADKMDKVKSGVGDFTTTATYGNVPTFQANNGQVEDSGHGIVNPDSPKGTDLVTVDYVTDKLDKKADIDSPTLTGTPKAPTPGSDADSTQIATVGYVQSQITGDIDRSTRLYLQHLATQSGGAVYDKTVKTDTCFNDLIVGEKYRVYVTTYSSLVNDDRYIPKTSYVKVYNGNTPTTSNTVIYKYYSDNDRRNIFECGTFTATSSMLRIQTYAVNTSYFGNGVMVYLSRM